MNSYTPSQRRRGRRGFTVVEIMIAVTIIGILAMLALPAINRTRQSAQNSRFVSDLRVFSQAFETYSINNGVWPPNAGAGIVPAGMEGDIKASMWQTTKNSVGGRWNWDRNFSGAAAAISTTNVTASDAQMQKIDRRIDDGDLTTGLFQKMSDRYMFILEKEN